MEVSRWHWFSHCMGPFVRLLRNSPIHSISLDTRSLSSEHVFRILRGLENNSFRPKSVHIVSLPEPPSRRLRTKDLQLVRSRRHFKPDEHIHRSLHLLAQNTSLNTFVSDLRLPISMLRSLSTVESLEHLQVNLTGDLQNNNNHADDWPVTSFPALRTLRVQTDHLSAMTAWLRDAGITSERLERIEYVVEPCASDFMTENALSEHMRTLASAPFGRTLRELVLTIKRYEHDYDSAEQPIPHIGLGALRPLEGCCNLAVLRVVADTMVLTIEGCQAIASACPQLEVLELLDGRNEHAAPLEGLAAIVQGCRKLVDLRIPVRVGGLWDIPKIHGEKVASTTIVHADIPLLHSEGTLIMQDHELWIAAVQYLRVLMPMAKSVTLLE